MTTEILVALAILVGLVGIVVPIMPGSLLVLGAIAVWAFTTATATGYVVLGTAAALIGLATLVKYVWPHRRLRAAAVPTRSIIQGGIAGIVGFFVIPLVGLPIGFVTGTYLAEHVRTRDRRAAWRATVAATKAVGLSLLVELTGALLAAGVWVVAVTRM
ncbi:DUF456 domain-containing protein [Solicola gregarius]|uniref:DUF456 domain-containing protein n=1 Tax=Solicola gregarius TaxID=2908642 RepID=A0AA46TI45_9ACTN|nr:DUF456 domain-containing protein [Solicola gregarius]UYM05284.1 DUF456 domain-containing protein [Solicola gregarius]